MVLAFIAHLDFPFDRNRPVAKFASQCVSTVRFEFREYGKNPGEIFRFELHNDGARRVDPRIGEQHAESRKVAGLGRNDHTRYFQSPGKLDAMQRTAAAVAK